MLRRSLRVRTIQASLQIEGNTLTEEQVTAVLEGKRVAAPERDLREVRNAIACYEKLSKWTPSTAKHLLAAHKIMMAGLVEQPGAWRSQGVGIAKGNQIAHIAPPAARVPGLMGSLLTWVRTDADVPAPIRAAVCHYEMEFIHPFEDGNGRMGRLWHSLILQRHHPLFAQVPVESAIRDRQADYYAVLGQCDKAGHSTAFIEFALELTLEALKHVITPRQPRMSSPSPAKTTSTTSPASPPPPPAAISRKPSQIAKSPAKVTKPPRSIALHDLRRPKARHENVDKLSLNCRKAS
jgi:Fic family protein